MAISLVEMIPSITLNDTFTGTVFVIQMITLDVAGFGLTSLAKAVKRAGDEETANTASTVGLLLIGIMVVSMLSGGIDRLFGAKIPAVKEWMLYVDDFLILVRVGMTVFYGKIMHSLRDSQQHMQAQTDTRIADLESDLTKARSEQKRLEKALSDEKEAAKKQHAENAKLAQQLADVQQSLRDTLQNGTSVQASMAEMIVERNENHSQIQSLQDQLSSLKTDLQSRTAELSQVRNSLVLASQNESSMKAKIDAAVKATELSVKAQMQAEIEELRRANKQLKEQMKTSVKAPVKPTKQLSSEKFDTRSFVFACLQKNPEMKLSEIVSLAKMEGQELSEPTISRYRKEYRESSSVTENESSAM
jgi:hypothetical protein